MLSNLAIETRGDGRVWSAGESQLGVSAVSGAVGAQQVLIPRRAPQRKLDLTVASSSRLVRKDLQVLRLKRAVIGARSAVASRPFSNSKPTRSDSPGPKAPVREKMSARRSKKGPASTHIQSVTDPIGELQQLRRAQDVKVTRRFQRQSKFQVLL